MNVYNVARVTCDANENGRECTETATYEEPMTRDTSEFVTNALAQFALAGWRVGGTLGCCLCPSHDD